MVAEEARYQWERHGDQGLRYLNFYDQNFLMNTRWLEDFAGAYRAMGMHTKLPFSAYSRVDHITEEKLELAQSAGCVQLRLGIEAGDQFVRNTLLNKELDQEVLESKLELIRKSGMHTLGYFMIGTPGETHRQATESWKLARRSGLDRAAFFFFTPLWDLQIMRDAGISVDYLERDTSTTLYQGGELTEAASGASSLRLKALFARSNGWFMARTIGRQLRAKRVRWFTDLLRYRRSSKADGMDLKLVMTQYVYFHENAFPLELNVPTQRHPIRRWVNSRVGRRSRSGRASHDGRAAGQTSPRPSAAASVVSSSVEEQNPRATPVALVHRPADRVVGSTSRPT
jgi:radical SAM superfamily enzyme YgiQ (UPF0313 family)